MTDRVGIVVLFPELLGTYGDGGNAVVLAKRLAWRGIDADIVTVGADQPVPSTGAVYLLGGGEDGAERAGSVPAPAQTQTLPLTPMHRACPGAAGPEKANPPALLAPRSHPHRTSRWGHRLAKIAARGCL